MPFWLQLFGPSIMKFFGAVLTVAMARGAAEIDKSKKLSPSEKVIVKDAMSGFVLETMQAAKEL